MNLFVNLNDFGDKCLIAMANALSEDINEIAMDQGSVEPELHTRLNHHFNQVCEMIESRGYTLSDHVVCPKQ